jgi:hypothetical protein
VRRRGRRSGVRGGARAGGVCVRAGRALAALLGPASAAARARQRLMARVEVRSWPDPASTRQWIYSAAWLVLAYMFLLTMFELIELLRPKPLGARPAERARPPAQPCGPGPDADLCPTAGRNLQRNSSITCFNTHCNLLFRKINCLNLPMVFFKNDRC